MLAPQIQPAADIVRLINSHIIIIIIIMLRRKIIAAVGDPVGWKTNWSVNDRFDREVRKVG